MSDIVPELEAHLMVLNKVCEKILKESEGIIIEFEGSWFIVYKYEFEMNLMDITDDKEFEDLMEYHDGEKVWIDSDIVEMAKEKKRKIFEKYH